MKHILPGWTASCLEAPLAGTTSILTSFVREDTSCQMQLRKPEIPQMFLLLTAHECHLSPDYIFRTTQHPVELLVKLRFYI